MIVSWMIEVDDAIQFCAFQAIEPFINTSSRLDRLV